MNPSVDGFLRKADQWRDEFTKLREICLTFDLTEEMKWMHPCYTYDNKNVVLIHGFKKYCALLFHKGALLKDSKNILIQQTKNVQAGRQLRFASLDEIVEQEAIIKEYIAEAIEVEKQGLEFEYKETSQFEMPEEFREKLDEDANLKAAFEALTPGRQRGYLLYFSGAKQSKTRASRVEKYIPNILDGKGLKD